MNKLYWFLLCFSIGVLFSCKKPPLSTSKANQEDIEKFKVQEIDFKYLTAKARINFKDADNDFNATANFRVKKDSIIWISLIPALGIEVSRCIVTKDTVMVLDRLNNQLHIYGYEALEKKINIHLNYNILQSMLLGGLPFTPQPTDQLTKSPNGDYLILKQLIEGMLVQSYVKSPTMKLEKLELKEEKTHKDLQVVYTNFQPVGTNTFPFNNQIHLTYLLNNNLQSTNITVEYHKVELPEKELNFPFNIPNKYNKK